MSTLDLGADSRRKPAEVISDVALSEEAVALMADCGNTLSYLHRLCDEELFHDAFLTLARTLPRQYAIIWADKCIETKAQPTLSDADKECQQLVRQWLSNPEDGLRRQAMGKADELDFAGPCAWLAAAVGFSGGSLSPADQQEVPPAQHLTAVAIAAGLTELTYGEPETAAETSRDLIDAGLEMVAIPGSSGKGH
ncbi:MAG: hypothetical protein QNI99_03575 [Woeseiaceae bacterium]|nr:hypothetical protein [Woeseiaceae bacterium]